MAGVTLHPVYALGGIALLAALADVLGRIVPFYRKDLQVESKTRLTPLDGLRGILCFAVMYHHADLTHGLLTDGNWFTKSALFRLLGHTSVALFFAVTGFLFWGRTLAKDGEIEPFAFLRGRVFRIAPLYLFTCFAVLCFEARHLNWLARSSYTDLAQMAMLGVRPWFNLTNQNLNMANAGVTWTLQFEWGFYLAIPALAMLVRGGKQWRILFVVAALWVSAGLTEALDYRPYFLTGIAAAHVARIPAVVAVLRKWYSSIPVVFATMALPVLVEDGEGWIALVLTSIIFIPIACGNSVFGILNLRGLRLMGIISYSVYLLHGTFLYECRPLLRAALAHSDLRYWICIFALACLVLIFCLVTYRFVEWPAMEFEKKLRRRPPTSSR